MRESELELLLRAVFEAPLALFSILAGYALQPYLWLVWWKDFFLELYSLYMESNKKEMAQAILLGRELFDGVMTCYSLALVATDKMKYSLLCGLEFALSRVLSLVLILKGESAI